MKILLLAGLITMVCTPALRAVEHVATSATPSFNQQIRPILSKNCFACHGPDEGERQADLRLDIAGPIDFDELIDRITSTDPDLMMPPPGSNKKLESDQIELLSHWIAGGARHETHWSFVPPTQSGVPADVHPVDYFVDRRLAQVGLEPAPRADPYTLLRRVYLDLIGLPPTLEEADAFVADPSSQAYLAIVDQLLASPRYGERWARRWLDLARYADTNGYEKDRDRTIWPFRDWVIRALNSGMPFDEFTIAQLAGDMLDKPTSDQIVATGFHRNTMLNEEGGIDPLEFRYHAMTDRVATTGTTWLGLTTGCAQCHSHKYDPITHHDYFGMMAYLDNADEPDYYLPSDDAQAQQQENIAAAREMLDKLPQSWPKPEQTTEGKELPIRFDAAFEKWLDKQRANLIDWQTIVPESMSANTPYLTQASDGVVYARGDISKHDIYTLKFSASKTPITALRLEALPDERLPGGGPGLTYYEAPKGDFYLSEFQIEDANGTNYKIANASDTNAKKANGNIRTTAEQAVDGDIQSGWSVGDRTGSRHVAVFRLADPIPAGAEFTIRMHFGRYYASSLGKFRLSATDSRKGIQATLLTSATNSTLDQPDMLADAKLREAFLLQSPQLADQAKKYHALRYGKTGTPTLVMHERPAEHSRPTYLYHRGEYTQPEEQILPRLPAALWPEDQSPPANRLEFARWLVSRDNPLTARVVANRAWATFFGTGIVKTLDDFGTQGELPSHPELLDYLAVELMNQGWSMKALHRLIVSSQAYQRSSLRTGQTDFTDRERLLQRFPRERLEAEIIRDASLVAAGLLNDTMYGPPVRPPQPAAAQSANYSKSKWLVSPGADRFRRSVYTYQKRTAPFAMFTTFDGTSGETCVAQRDVSNTPLQALTLMNDPMFIEISEAFGKRMAASEGDVSERITTGFRWLLTRPPSENELELLSGFHAKHSNWTALARVILSLDEAISKN